MTETICRRFVGQVAFITGGAKGIGRACALRFAQEGAHVASFDLDQAANQETVAGCRELGVEALAITGDVRDREAVQGAVAQLMERWGHLDVVVASAGIFTGGPLDQVPLEEWQKTLATNLTGVFLVNQAVAPILRSQGRGSIINISSMAGKTSFPGNAAYSASKSGVIGLTRSVAMELAPYGVTVNALCPGNTLTDMVRQVAEQIGGSLGMSGEAWLAMRAEDCPMKRIAEPWEMAGVVAFLASEDARYLTGQAIEVDGGMVLC